MKKDFLSQKRRLRWIGLGIVALLSTSCNNGFIHKYEKLKPTGGDNLGDVLSPGTNTNGDLKIIDGARTIAVTHAGQVLKNMLSISGVETPSSATLDMYELKKTSFSENGRANSLNAPIVMATAAVGGEVCNDLITQEKGKAAVERRIFNQIDFTARVANLSENARADSIRRLARSFWGRDETPAELQVIQDGVTEAITAGGTAVRDTELVVLYLCTAMISSLDAYTL